MGKKKPVYSIKVFFVFCFSFFWLMAPKWCFGLDSHKHTQTLTSTLTQIPSFFPLLTLYHHANPACFTRQETERLIVIPRGSADLSQICLRPAPHSTSFPHCLAPRNQWNLSSAESTGNVGNLRAEPSPLGDPSPERQEALRGELSKDGEGDRERKALLCSKLLRATEPKLL